MNQAKKKKKKQRKEPEGAVTASLSDDVEGFFGGLWGHMANKKLVAHWLSARYRAPVVNMCDLFILQQLTVMEEKDNLRGLTWSSRPLFDWLSWFHLKITSSSMS